MLKLETWNVENTKMKMLIRGFFSSELSASSLAAARQTTGGRARRGAAAEHERAGAAEHGRVLEHGWAWRRSMRLRGGSDMHGEEGGREEEKFRVE